MFCVSVPLGNGNLSDQLSCVARRPALASTGSSSLNSTG